MRFHTIYESSRAQGKHPPMLMAFAGRHRNVFRTQIPKSHVAPCCTRNSLIDLARSAQFRNGQLPGSDSRSPASRVSHVEVFLHSPTLPHVPRKFTR
jgi:hypothetical protein